ncbi:MAG: transposase, partial [Hydrogenophaga sp.]
MIHKAVPQDPRARASSGLASVTASSQGGKKRRLRLSGPEFIGRFLQHILPTGLKRIRHCG